MEAATIAMQRIARGRQEKSQMLLGLRGVGKTVLLNRIAQIAEDMGAYVVTLEAPEGQRLAAFDAGVEANPGGMILRLSTSPCQGLLLTGRRKPLNAATGDESHPACQPLRDRLQRRTCNRSGDGDLASATE